MGGKGIILPEARVGLGVGEVTVKGAHPLTNGLPEFVSANLRRHFEYC